MSCTLNITNNPFDSFPVHFSGILHKSRNHTNNKGNYKSTVCKINNIVYQLSIECSIDFGRLKSFFHLKSRLKRSSVWLTIYHLKMCQAETIYISIPRSESLLQTIKRILKLTNNVRIYHKTRRLFHEYFSI
jgi:hypothetical protein